MTFFLWLFFVRLGGYLGSKRVIGTFNGLAWGVFGITGILVILTSRRLDDTVADAYLKEKYKPVDQVA